MFLSHLNALRAFKKSIYGTTLRPILIQLIYVPAISCVHVTVVLNYLVLVILDLFIMLKVTSSSYWLALSSALQIFLIPLISALSMYIPFL